MISLLVLSKFTIAFIVEASIETDFSGTTFTCAVIRGNNCTLCNVGDSRTSLAYRNKSGGVTAVALTIDHKPDLPAEKVSIESGHGLSFSYI